MRQPTQVPISLVRNDGIIYATGLTFTYTPEPGPRGVQAAADEAMRGRLNNNNNTNSNANINNQPSLLQNNQSSLPSIADVPWNSLGGLSWALAKVQSCVTSLVFAQYFLESVSNGVNGSQCCHNSMSKELQTFNPHFSIYLYYIYLVTFFCIVKNFVFFPFFYLEPPDMMNNFVLSIYCFCFV